MKIRRRADLAWTKMDQDFVVLDLGPDRFVHQLNPMASFVWELLAEPNDMDMIVERTCAEFSAEPEEVRLDMQQLIEDFQERSLVETIV